MPCLPLPWRGTEGEVKTTIMKKLLTYLLLIACFESFISSTPCYYCRHNLSNSTDLNVPSFDETLQQDDIDSEIHPLDIFTFRYF